MARGIRDDDDEGANDEHSIELCKGVQETALAVLVRGTSVEEPFKDVWIPKSVISDDSEVYAKGTDGTLIVKGWFAKREGWT